MSEIDDRAITLSPIGVAISPVTELVDSGWGNIETRIDIHESYRAGLCGLSEYSHVVILFYMHRATFDKSQDLVRRPRGRADMPEVGIFAQRAKHRPNALGVTTVKLVSVDDKGIVVRGLDAIDQTPILDIKPYLPQFDTAEKVVTPQWANDLLQDYF